MDPAVIFSGLWGALFLVIILVVIFAKRGRRRVGSGAAGTMYDWQTSDRRRATEIIVEERAAARDPEHADGTLPDPGDVQPPSLSSERGAPPKPVRP